MKSIFIILFFCCMSSMVLSQDLVIKPTVGINVSNFSKNPSSGEFTGQVGWQVGGSIVYGRKFYIEPGVFYGQQTSKYATNANAPADTSLKFDISGIRIPLTIGYNFIGNEKGAFNIRAFVGGSAFILTSVSQGAKSDYTSPVWGVFAGAGVDFLIFFVDLKYEWSLTNVQNDVSAVDFGKSRTFYANIGVKIPL